MWRETGQETFVRGMGLVLGEGFRFRVGERGAGRESREKMWREGERESAEEVREGGRVGAPL